MTSQEENVAFVRTAVDAYGRGDIETVLSMLDQEHGIIYMPPALPNAGTFHGKDGFIEWLGNWLEAWDDFKVEIERIEPVGERHVVVDMHQSATGKGSGVPVEMNIAYMWEVRDGKFVAQHLYPTWDEAMTVARGREAQSD